jgi:hypothetical protein
MRRNNGSPLMPVIMLFILFNAFFLTGKNFLEKNGFDQGVLIVGNLILFTVTLLSFWISLRNLKSEDPNKFVRGAMMNTMLKIFICAIAAFIYIFSFRNQLNKPALFACIALYFIYTLFEVSILTRLLKGKKNA